MTELVANRACAPSRAAFSLNSALVMAVPTLLFTAALLPRLMVIAVTHFDGLYGQDAYAYFGYAGQTLEGLLRGQPPEAFWWPLGYPLLLNASFVLLGQSIRSAQLVTLLCGAAIAPITYLLARAMTRDSRTNLGPILASLVVALGGQVVQSSVVIMADAPGLLWAAIGVWLLLRFGRTDSLLSGLFSGLAMGLAVITRWENLALSLVWFAAIVVATVSAMKHTAEEDRVRLVVKKGLVPVAAVALLVLPQLMQQLSNGSPLAGQSWLDAWNPSNAVLRVFDNVDGHFEYQLPVAAFYAQVFFHPAYLFPVLTPFLVIGAWLVAKRAFSDLTAILLLGWISSLLFFLFGIPYENFRFGLGMLVPVAVLTGVGAESTWQWLSSRSVMKHRALFRGLFILMVLISLMGLTLWQSRSMEPILARKQFELTLTRWADSRIPPEGTLFTFDATAALKMYGHTPVKDISEETPDTIMASVRTAAPAYLLIDLPAVEKQWHGHQLGDTIAYLKQGSELTQLDQLENWTLYKITARQ